MSKYIHEERKKESFKPDCLEFLGMKKNLWKKVLWNEIDNEKKRMEQEKSSALKDTAINIIPKWRAAKRESKEASQEQPTTDRTAGEKRGDKQSPN